MMCTKYIYLPIGTSLYRLTNDTVLEYLYRYLYVFYFRCIFLNRRSKQITRKVITTDNNHENENVSEGKHCLSYYY